MVISLGVTELKKTSLVYFLNLFGGREEEGWCDFGGYVNVFFTYVSMVLVL